ncbi:MAG: PHP domain-containing protein, partial [Ruminococcus sp.]|nr:PHP domain-containing protein [Ruminococcus sp.]
MKYFYDLHIHSCLSPCGDMDMTPNNIVNMAKLLGLDVIALTDHNTTLNCEAAIEAGKEIGLVVIPGMELTTSEDIHAVCLFPTLDKALLWNEYVDKNRIKIKNKAEIYGRQVIMNSADEEVGEIEELLLPSSNISIMNAYKKVKEFGGICYPAHIDRDSLSILSVLGEIDE